MDKEQQIQLRFLDEAEDCYDKIESVLLGLTSKVAESDSLDQALRASHSVKGGAAMMGLAALSTVAHRLEDFFKILRVHHVSQTIDTEVATLLLQSLDSLRRMGDCYRQGIDVDSGWIAQHIHPIFDQLQTCLGDVTDADENVLLSQDDNETDPALLMFEDGVAAILDRIESCFDTLPIPQLTNELVMTAEELIAFGHMANLEPFIRLCQSVQKLADQITPDQIPELSIAALKTWRRSHALVLRRRFEKLSSQLLDFTPILVPGQTDDLANALDLMDLSSHQANFDSLEMPTEAISFTDPAVADLAAALATDLSAELPIEVPNPDLFAANDLDEQALTDPQNTFTAEDSPKISELEDVPLTLESAAQILQQATTSTQAAPAAKPMSGKTVRIPVEQLEQFNSLFGKLILERNTVNLQYEQLQTFTNLMRQRIHQLDSSNAQLQQWYDHASMEGVVLAEGAGLESSSPEQQQADSSSDQFDTLEMDRYTGLHLIAQEQIETIVQLQEVGIDIDFILQDMGLAIRDLNQTTRSLQSNITRTQRVVFGEIVKRFPRVLRDLSVQFNKSVKLVIEGENILIDRAMVEPLGDVLNHLLRNAFDHGIESPDHRLSIGKMSEGTIAIKAQNQGTQTIITLTDDGAGICLDKVRERLQRMGWTQDEMLQISEDDLLSCIFEPGFSTADQVTEVSGRGVGMDVVRTHLRDMRGDIHIDTKHNQGTTFTLTVPHTLSILRVMLLEHSGLIFAIPEDSSRELLCLQGDQVQSVERSQRFIWQDRSIPVVSLAKHWTFKQTRKFPEMLVPPVIDQPTMLVVGGDAQVGGIEIERFWGEQEVTIRTINSPLPLPPGFISSTVLGCGRVVPIIDPLFVMNWCLEQAESGLVINPSEVVQEVASTVQSQTILVVDDSVNVRRHLAFTLEKAGYLVEQAKDGQEAVDKLETIAVQAIVCDIEMPRLDGYGVLEEIRGQSRFEALPVVMLTSRSHDKHRKMAMNLGASAYFSKPFNEQELLDTLAELVSEQVTQLVV